MVFALAGAFTATAFRIHAAAITFVVRSMRGATCAKSDRISTFRWKSATACRDVVHIAHGKLGINGAILSGILHGHIAGILQNCLRAVAGCEISCFTHTTTIEHSGKLVKRILIDSVNK